MRVSGGYPFSCIPLSVYSLAMKYNNEVLLSRVKQVERRSRFFIDVVTEAVYLMKEDCYNHIQVHLSKGDLEFGYPPLEGRLCRNSLSCHFE